MDPDEALTRLRRLIVDGASLPEIAEQFDALDGWICSGGFLPADWAQPSTSTGR